MSRRPVQDVRIWALGIEGTTPGPASRATSAGTVDGARFSWSFRTKSLGDHYRSRLLVAHRDGERFDLRSGEPASWAPAPDEMPVYAWARQWVGEEWQEWAPRTRQAVVESLARFLPLVVDQKAPEPPAGLRSHLTRTLPPAADVDEQADAERWLMRWGLTLGDLTRELLSDVERRLALGDKGQPLSAATAGRYRKYAHRCLRRAVELGRLEADPWPPTPKGRSQRKSRRERTAIDVRQLPDPETMASIIKAIKTHQPGSRNYQVMTAVMYYAGLRPSEVVMLRPKALRLPDEGWGAIDVVEAEIDWDEPGEPKTGDRVVPIPPELVARLRSWDDEHELAAALLFRTRNDRRPTPRTGAEPSAGLPGCRPRPECGYDCRHACATTWLRAGVPLGEVARRLGHSVETLHERWCARRRRRSGERAYRCSRLHTPVVDGGARCLRRSPQRHKLSNMADGRSLEQLLDALDRLRTHVTAVRQLSSTARDDIATVLHLLVGGGTPGDGYGVLKQGLHDLGLPSPTVTTWDSDMPEVIDGKPVVLGLRGRPTGEVSTGPLPDLLEQECLRFAMPGLQPQENWSYLDLVKKVRNKFGGHIDRKPPKWLRDLRFFPAGDSDAVTFLLWSAAEITLEATTAQLADAGVDIERYEPGDQYLDGIDLSQAYVLAIATANLDVRAELACATWKPGRRRAIVGALFGDQPFVFGLEGDGRVSLTLGASGSDVADLARAYRGAGFARVGRNEPCPCASGRKYKHCHGR